MSDELRRESVLDAFLRQTGIEPSNPRQSEMSEGLSMQDRQAQAEAMRGMDTGRNLRSQTEPPTRLGHGARTDETAEHEYFAGYDHSLEENRWRKIEDRLHGVE